MRGLVADCFRIYLSAQRVNRLRRAVATLRRVEQWRAALRIVERYGSLETTEPKRSAKH